MTLTLCVNITSLQHVCANKKKTTMNPQTIFKCVMWLNYNGCNLITRFFFLMQLSLGFFGVSVLRQNHKGHRDIVEILWLCSECKKCHALQLVDKKITFWGQ